MSAPTEIGSGGQSATVGLFTPPEGAESGNASGVDPSGAPPAALPRDRTPACKPEARDEGPVSAEGLALADVEVASDAPNPSPWVQARAHFDLMSQRSRDFWGDDRD